MTKPESAPANLTLPKFQVSRVVSLILLICVIAILGAIFYQVMARFVVPLFLSALLVVIFRPLHGWILKKVKGRQQLGALLTTLTILLLVLIPISSVVFMAATEGSIALKHINAPKILEDLSNVRGKLNLNMPNARELRSIESQLATLQEPDVLDEELLEAHSAIFFEIMSDGSSIADEQKLDWPLTAIAEDEVVPLKDMRGHWRRFGNELIIARGYHEDIRRLTENKGAPLDESRENKPAEDMDAGVEDADETGENKSKDNKHEKMHEYIKTIGKANSEFLNFKLAMLGGRTKATIIETANPTSEDLREYSAQLSVFLKEKLFALGGSISTFFLSTFFGAVIMVIGLYFFLLDGPVMLKNIQTLSPIEDEHEQELAEEFARVSRAVVVATLLSAAVQGLLAGIGFWVCGLDSIFLLTLISGVLAMVPFVGAAAVWIPCALYLFFVENRPITAIGLAAYGGLIISMADNVIKPWILHGQSNLHPLLALLSVIGGVAVLGPIGILVGPMIVVFLQTSLKILRREMQSMEGEASDSEEKSVAEA